MKRPYYLIVFFFLALGCAKDKPGQNPNAPVVLSQEKKVYVINEGNFMSGNASITLYDKGNGLVVEDIYNNVNSSKLGDVAQSMSLVNGKYYVLVNNSGKIIVCDLGFKKVAEIGGLSSPRYMVQVSNQKAYVSDYKANAIAVLDLNNNTILKSIPCPGWTEAMVVIYNKVFVTNIKKNYLYVLDATKDLIVDSILIGPGASDLQIDRNDKIWVLTKGSQQGAPPKLLSINAVNNQIERDFSFSASALPGHLQFNARKDTLYYIDTKVFRMTILDALLPQKPFIDNGKKVFYGLGINPYDFNIYIADALDYVQRSNIYIYNSLGVEKSRFSAGIISNGFYFE